MRPHTRSPQSRVYKSNRPQNVHLASSPHRIDHKNRFRCAPPSPRHPHATPHYTTPTHDPLTRTATTMPSSAFPSPSSSQYFGIGVHQGAVDPSTVTSAPPPEVMKHILGVLQGMGVVITEESKFRLRCVRPLRRDSCASDRTTSSEESANSVRFFHILITERKDTISREDGSWAWWLSREYYCTDDGTSPGHAVR